MSRTPLRAALRRTPVRSLGALALALACGAAGPPPVAALTPTPTPVGPTPTPGVTVTPTFGIVDIDLSVSAMRVELERPACLVVGDTLGVRVTVVNSYSGRAGPFDVEVNGVRQRVAGGLAGRSTVSLFFPGYANGTNVAVVDPGNEVSEVSESNNRLEAILPIPTPPRPCTPTATPTAGDGGTVTRTPSPTPTPTRAITFTPTATATSTRTPAGPTSTPTSTPTAVVTPTPTPVAGGQTDGFGVLRTRRGRALFAFAVRRSGAEGEVTGGLFYANSESGLVVAGDTVDTLTVEGGTATFSGSGTCAGGGGGGTPCDFTVKVQDGRGGDDLLSITVPGSGTEAGRVVAGDIRVSGPGAP